MDKNSFSTIPDWSAMHIEDFGKDVVLLNEEMLKQRAKISEGFMACCNKMVKRAKEIGDNNLLGYSYYFLADAYYLLTTEYRKFNMNLLKAIEYLQSCGDMEYLARCYNLLGIDAVNHGNVELALDFYLTALKYGETLGSNSNIPGIISFNKGNLYFKHGDVRQALQYSKAAYKDIRKNRADSLYYRNLLYCYCFQIDCYIELNKPDSVEKCMQSIEQMEQDELISPEVFQDLPILDIKMRGYHFLGEATLYEKYADLLSYQLQHGKFPLDSMDDLYNSCRFFMRVGRVGEVDRILKNARRSVDDLNIYNLRKGYAKVCVEFFEKMDRSEDKTRALAEYFDASIQQEKESIANYRFFMNIRNRLSSMEQENVQLLKQAETDPLTGLGNRYGLNKYADSVFEDAYANQKSLAVEILDVDNFKHYNDTYGHQMGDQCLKNVAESIHEVCKERSNIKGFRYGGDEFVIIYEGMTDDEIMEIATGLRDTIAAIKMDDKKSGKAVSVTVSQGIRNSVPSETNKLWDYMYAADNALYDVKKTKKGEVVLLHKALISQKSLDEAQHS